MATDETLGPDDLKSCPYCAETIKAAARICRFCNRDQDPNSDRQLKPQAQATQEVVILQVPDTLVTDSRIVIRNVTYALANVTSVSKSSKTLNAGDHINFGIAAYIAITVVFAMTVATIDGRLPIDSNFHVPIWVILTAPAFLTYALTRYYRKIRPVRFLHSLRIGSASGEVNVLSAEDGPHIDRIVGAINTAMTKRK